MFGALVGRPQNRGQSPGSPGADYGEIEQTPAALLGGGFMFQDPGPMQPRNLGQSPGGEVRIVDGAQGLGMFGLAAPLNSVLQESGRALVPDEFYDGQTDTEPDTGG